MISARCSSFVLAIAALGTGLGLAGCGTLDDKKIEASITENLKTEGVEIKSIDCPSGRALKADDTFTCKVVDDDGESLDIKVTQTDAKGTIKWELEGRVLDVDKLGDSLEKEIGKGADVKCPKKAMILVKGKKFSCDVTQGDDTGVVVITVKDNEGNVTWKLNPKS